EDRAARIRDVAVSLDVAADDGLARRHRLEKHDSERLLARRRSDEDVALPIAFDQTAEGLGWMIRQPRYRGGVRRRAVLPDDVERPARIARFQHAERFDHGSDALAGIPQTADGEEPAGRSELRRNQRWRKEVDRT